MTATTAVLVLAAGLATPGDPCVGPRFGNTRIHAGEGPRDIAAGDFNGDGHLDFAVTNRSGGDLSVLLGRGDGAFEPEARYPVASQPVAIVAADIDGDQDLDLAVVLDRGTDLYLLENNGDGTFEPPYRDLAGARSDYMAGGPLKAPVRSCSPVSRLP